MKAVIHIDVPEFQIGQMAQIYFKDTMMIRGTVEKEKIGHWITGTEGIITTLYRCSECNKTVIDDTGYDVYKDYPFCHCGARMIGG